MERFDKYGLAVCVGERGSSLLPCALAATALLVCAETGEARGLRTGDGPACKRLRELDYVGLRVTGADAHRVEFENFAGEVFI